MKDEKGYKWQYKWNHEEKTSTDFIKERYETAVSCHKHELKLKPSSTKSIAFYSQYEACVNEFASYGMQSVHFFLERMSEGDVNANMFFRSITKKLEIKVPYHLHGTTTEENRQLKTAFIESLNRPDLDLWSSVASPMHDASLFIPYFQSLEEESIMHNQSTSSNSSLVESAEYCLNLSFEQPEASEASNFTEGL